MPCSSIGTCKLSRCCYAGVEFAWCQGSGTRSALRHSSSASSLRGASSSLKATVPCFNLYSIPLHISQDTQLLSQSRHPHHDALKTGNAERTLRGPRRWPPGSKGSEAPVPRTTAPLRQHNNLWKRYIQRWIRVARSNRCRLWRRCCHHRRLCLLPDLRRAGHRPGDPDNQVVRQLGHQEAQGDDS
jgi:hypothetical protein